MVDSIDSEKLLFIGVCENEFYVCLKENKCFCIIDLVFYEMGGKIVMMLFFNVLIMVGDQFCGVVGVDFLLVFIQDLFKCVDQQFYDGVGEMVLIVSNGCLVVYICDDSKFGEFVGSVFDGNEVDNLKNFMVDQLFYDIDVEYGYIELFLFFIIVDSGVCWIFMLQIFQVVVFGELQ